MMVQGAEALDGDVRSYLFGRSSRELVLYHRIRRAFGVCKKVMTSGIPRDMDDIEACGVLKGFEAWRTHTRCPNLPRYNRDNATLVHTTFEEARLACLLERTCNGVQYLHDQGAGDRDEY